MLLRSAKGNSYVIAQAQEILGAGTRAAELISQLLAFSRRQLIKPKLIEINQFVQDVERMLCRIIGEHIEFRTELDPWAGWIYADRNQMEGILLNLATNARDAMPQGGVLTIATARVEIAPGAPSVEPHFPPGSYVRLTVTDTGNGMDCETQQHIFEPFFTTKAQGKGTGLGMSSVYGSVEQNDGRISVMSEVGKGTTFSIFLPRKQEPVFLENPANLPVDQSRGIETIVLVEDETSVRRMLREVLSTAGYRVWEAENGAEAIAQWGSALAKVDLVVTDIVMPVMNGLKLAEELRHRIPGLRFIFMSGHSEDIINGQTAPHTPPDILQKPFAPDVLVRKVREALDAPTKPARTGGMSKIRIHHRSE
jgi:CheY-like chemotaxis protein